MFYVASKINKSSIMHKQNGCHIDDGTSCSSLGKFVLHSYGSA
jgi:hypothetical protein